MGSNIETQGGIPDTTNLVCLVCSVCLFGLFSVFSVCVWSVCPVWSLVSGESLPYICKKLAGAYGRMFNTSNICLFSTVIEVHTGYAGGFPIHMKTNCPYAREALCRLTRPVISSSVIEKV